MFLIVLLLVCNILTPLVFVFKQCFIQGKIEVNHIFLFSIGFVIYWILPFVVGEGHWFSAAGGVSLWYGLFDQIPQGTVLTYLLMCLGIYLAFCAGILLCRRIYPGSQTEVRPFFFDRRLLNVFLMIGVGVAGIYAIILRNDFFHGYATADIGNVGQRGTFTAVSIFLLSLALLYSLKQQETQPGVTFRHAVSNYVFVIYFIVAILVLSMGGRLYLVSSVIMLLIYRSVYFEKIAARPLLLVATIAVVAVGTLGTLRLGAAFSLADAGFNLISEPLFNSFSLLQFLIDGRLEMVNAPIFLAGDFINILPSALFPQKATLLLNPEDYGYRVYSPLGSLSSFFSFMINFGFLGTMAFMFLMAFVLQRLRSRGRSLLTKTIYIMVSGWLATTFFRDPFSISLVKSIFQYSIIFPIIIVVSVASVTVWVKGTPEQHILPDMPVTPET